jgi:hypothetical protein
MIEVTHRQAAWAIIRRDLDKEGCVSRDTITGVYLDKVLADEEADRLVEQAKSGTVYEVQRTRMKIRKGQKVDIDG